MLGEIAIIAAAILIGAGALVFIIRRQIRRGASYCSNCPHGKSITDCSLPEDAPDLPPGCDKKN
jgi:hypothetical protein